jgi:hypothetical protein
VSKRKTPCKEGGKFFLSYWIFKTAAAAVEGKFLPAWFRQEVAAEEGKFSLRKRGNSWKESFPDVE